TTPLPLVLEVPFERLHTFSFARLLKYFPSPSSILSMIKIYMIYIKEVFLLHTRCDLLPFPSYDFHPLILTHQVTLDVHRIKHTNLSNIIQDSYLLLV